jgi:Rha family phage regulatory protein
MNGLTVIKQNGVAYIDSREVAEAIGKRHDHLLRDINGYLRVLGKYGAHNFGDTFFFLESSYVDAWNREKPCYLISRRGADIIANKLTGEKGVLFTAAYVTKFHEMAEREHASEIESLKVQAVTPKLGVFNTAVRAVLSGMAIAKSPPGSVMNFLRGAYKPFGINVGDCGNSRNSGYFSPTVIAAALNMFSRSGRPHGHAAAAIISKLNFDPAGHIEIAPYGLAGFSARYDAFIARGVADWLEHHDFPRSVPHRDFEYHVSYNRETSIFGDSGGDIFVISDAEIDEMCGKYSDCGYCPYRKRCAGDFIRG